MRRIIASGVLGIFMLGSAIAAGGVKYTFTEAQFRDASGNVIATGTIQAGVKTTRKSQVINCGYYTNPNDQYVGEFESTDRTVNGDSAESVRSFCEANFENRQITR